VQAGTGMKRDNIFLKTTSRNADFEFNSEVAEVFDDMLIRSIPFYLEQQYMIKEIGRKFWIPGRDIYDLGCATGTTLINLCREIDGPHFIGYDNSLPMLEQAEQKVKENGLEGRIEFRRFDLNEDISQLSLKNAGIVLMCWTLQFIRPLQRDRLIRHIYDGLIEDGVLVVAEKVLTNSTHMNRFFIDLYYDFKKRNGYTDTEIQRKREALENMLIPYRVDENIEMFQRSGFKIVNLFFLWYNFAGFLCLKKSG
jgi:tRNA (cmo5U34)-methyltransferase